MQRRAAALAPAAALLGGCGVGAKTEPEQFVFARAPLPGSIHVVNADGSDDRMLARFPDGATPPGMLAGMQAAGGRSLQAAD